MDVEELVEEVVSSEDVTLKKPLPPLEMHGEGGSVGYGRRSNLDSEKKKLREDKLSLWEVKKKEMEMVLGMYLSKREAKEERDGEVWKDNYCDWVAGNIKSGFVDLGDKDVEYTGKDKIVHKATGIFETCEPGSEGGLIAKLHGRLTDHLGMWKTAVGKEVTGVDAFGNKIADFVETYNSLENRIKLKLRNKYPGV